MAWASDYLMRLKRTHNAFGVFNTLLVDSFYCTVFIIIERVNIDNPNFGLSLLFRFDFSSLTTAVTFFNKPLPQPQPLITSTLALIRSAMLARRHG
jgi:hypothetical protein